MNRRSSGCITASGFLTVLLTLLVFSGVYAMRGGQMFNPGPLNAVAAEEPKGGIVSHAETGGNCEACHVAPWNSSTMDDRCLDCHTEIKSQLGEPTTLHGILTSGAGQFTCRECHTDHNGSEAGLTLAEIKDFPHEMVGFALDGHESTDAGETFQCADCHEDGIAHFAVEACIDCHAGIEAVVMEAHQAAFGENCLGCHDGIDRYGESFDHNKAYPLLGKHAQADCASCHTGARSVEDLQAAPQQCYDCHVQDDAHRGEMGTECQACHVEEGWERVSFDHNLTDFPLAGKHEEAGCQDCHQELRFRGTPINCIACHAEDDTHGGQFGEDCGFCHSPIGWEDVSFDHSLTAFPLTGKHLEVECAGCHLEGTFGGTSTACEACHKEPEFHLGLFAATCEDCHKTEGWTPAMFNEAHTFPINHGAEGASSCRTCHADSLSSYTCYGCHEHTQAEITEEHLEEGISNFTDCVSCHPSGLEDEAEGRGGGGDN